MSALIFVAVAVAWAVYLVPKALRHHEEDAASRTVEQISDRVRVLARRDAVTAKSTSLVAGDPSVTRVTTGGRDAEAGAGKGAGKGAGRATGKATGKGAAEVAVEVERTISRVTETSRINPVQRQLRRAAARRAAQRRRRVLLTLLFAVVATAATAIGGYIAPVWSVIPTGLVLAWLVLCRVMVRRERAARTAAPVRRTDDVQVAPNAASDEAADESSDLTDEIPAVVIAAVDGDDPVPAPGTWAPVPVTLPTYVAKAQASRTVRTIDLDSTGVWSSGRNADDSELAREAEAQDRTSRAASSDDAADQRRASGS